MANTRDEADLFDENFLKKLEYLHLVSRKIFTGQGRAERRTRKVGSGIEFADHREYAAGDDFRYIDWNILGRTERLLLRLFEEEEDLYIYLMLDVSDSMRIGDSTKLLYGMQVTAALSYVGLANLDRVGVVTLADGIAERLAPTRGKRRIFKVFRFLNQCRRGGPTKLAAATQAFVHQNRRRGLAVLISDFYDPEGYEEAINVLRYNRFEPYVIQLYDAQEAYPQVRGDVQIVDCETSVSRNVTISPTLLKAFSEAHNAYCRELEDFCRGKQVPFLRADVTIPFSDLVLRIFRSGGFLR